MKSSILLLTFASALPLYAVTYQWDPNGTTAGLGGAGTWLGSVWDTIGSGGDLGVDATIDPTWTSADAAIFGGASGGVVTRTAGDITLNGVTFNTTTNSTLYTLAGSSIFTLAGAAPTITANANATISSILAGSAGLVKAGAGTLTLAGNNTFSGGATVNAGFVRVATIGNSGGNSPLGTGGTVNLVQGTGGIIYTGAGETTNKVINYNSAAAGGFFTHNGTGLLTFSNAATTTATAAFGVTFNGHGQGSLVGITQPALSVLINFNKLEAGTWTLTGLNNLKAGNFRAQGGVLAFAATATTGSGAEAAALTRNGTIGGVLQIANGAQVFTGTANTNNILGGWATFDNSTWAVTNGTTTAVSGLASFADDAWAAGNNTNLTVAGANPGSDSTTNSLRFHETGAKILTLAGINTLTSGGILVTSAVGANTTTITGGTLAGANTADLIVHQHNTAGGLTIASIIANNTGATGLTKTGAGLLRLNGPNSFTGNVMVSGGTLQFGVGLSALGAGNTAVSKVAVASGATVDFNGQIDNTYGYTIAGTGIGGNGALVNNGSAIGNNTKQASNIKLAGDASIGGTGNWALLASGFAATSLDLGGNTLTKSGANTISLVNTAVTAGNITVAGGTLATAQTASTAASTALTLNNTAGASLSLGTAFAIGSLAGGGNTGGNVALGTNTLTVGALNTDTTYAGVISSGTGGTLVKTGTGALTLSNLNTYSGGTSVGSGTLNLTANAGFNGTGSTVGTGALTIDSGATVNASTFAISGDTSAGNSKTVNVSGTLNVSASNYLKTLNLTGGTINAPNTANEFIRTSAAGLFINSLASANPSTIANKVDLTFGNLAVDTADGAAATDLTFSGVISENQGAGTGAKTLTKSGAGTLAFSGGTANSYTGLTTISAGILSLAKNDGITAVAGNILVNGTGQLVTTANASGRIADGSSVTIDGSTASFSFGSNQNDTISILSINNGGTVNIGGSSSNLRPNGGITSTGGGAITQTSGAAGLNFNGGVRSVTVADSTLSIATPITNGGLTKFGNGILSLTSSSSYTGATTITAGTLSLGASNVIGDGSALILNGGTLLTGTGQTETAASLSLTAPSTITMGGTTGTSILTFSGNPASYGLTTNTLNIWNWNGSFSGGGDDRLILPVGSLSAGELANISFYSGSDNNGFLGTATFASAGELVPVPEPGALPVAAILGAQALMRRRRVCVTPLP